MKSERLYLVVPLWLKDAMKQAATSKGVTLSEYIKDAMKEVVKNDKKQEVVPGTQTCLAYFEER